MTPFPFRDGAIASCAQCRGVWIPRRLIEAATSSGTLSLRFPDDPTFAPSSARCPDDGQPLREIAHKGIRVDYCPACRGLWLDDKELAHLRHHSPAAPATRRKPLLEAADGLDAVLTWNALDLAGALIEWLAFD